MLMNLELLFVMFDVAWIELNYPCQVLDLGLPGVVLALGPRVERRDLRLARSVLRVKLPLQLGDVRDPGLRGHRHSQQCVSTFLKFRLRIHPRWPRCAA